MIGRRAAAMGLISAVAAPGTVGAQPQRPARKIGYVFQSQITRTNSSLDIMRRAWQALGYVEGETILPRSAELDPTRLPALVAELLRLDIGVLIAQGAPAVRAASLATTTMPIVAIDLETDPVRAGYVTSVARPGGNVTGLFMDTASLATKWLEFLLETMPTLERVGILWDPATSRDQLEAVEAAARSRGIEAVVIETQASNIKEGTLRGLGTNKRTALMQLSTPGNQATVLALATHYYRLPTITFLKVVADQALLSYGPDQEAYFPRAVVLADRILKGAKVSDLPIERPVKFELVVNTKTAKEIGLTVPSSILARADEVIE